MKYLMFLLFPCLAFAEVIVGPNSNWSDPRYGDYNALGINESGQITQTLQAGEDETNDVIRVEGQFEVCIDDADIVCKASAGFVHSVWCYEEDGAPTAGTVRVTNTTAAGGAETTEVWGMNITTTVGSGTGSAVLDIIMDTGIVIDFTTTADVKCGVSYR